MLLKAERDYVALFALLMLIITVLFSFVLISTPQVSFLPEENKDLSIPTDNTVTVSIVPSGAPIVKPPTYPETMPPTASGNVKKIRLNVPAAKYSLSADDSQVIKPIDSDNNPLLKCDDDAGVGPYGSYPERGYYSEDVVCLHEFDDSSAEFACSALVDPKSTAASYTSDGSRICRCGNIPVQQGLCAFTTSTKFIYTAESLTDKPLCDEKIDWNLGKFENGRYVHPTCGFMNVSPRNLVKKFANKFFLFDGDSHQQDLFFGFLNEVRNRKFFAIGAHAASNSDGKDCRYEVSEFSDHITCNQFQSLKFNDDLLKCVTKDPCVVFVYRFDRYTVDYVHTANSAKVFPPDYVIGAFISKTYASSEEGGAQTKQVKTKAAWVEVFDSLKKPISMAWTSFPMNSGDIVGDMSTWISTLNHSSLGKHFAIPENTLWTVIKRTPQEPGFLTLKLTWHDCCHVNSNYGKFNQILAAESCNSPIPHFLYAGIISIFSNT